MGVITEGVKFVTDVVATGAESTADVDATLQRRRERAIQMQAVADQEADTLYKGAQDAGALKMKGTQVQQEQAMAYAYSGVDADTGTAAQVGTATRIYAELDAATTMNNARREALGHRRVLNKLTAEQGAELTSLRNRQEGRMLSLIGGFGRLMGSAASSSMNLPGGGPKK